jgi:MFS family permease
MIMFYPAGKIMDAYGRKWTAVPGTIILAISLIILPLIPSYWGLVVFALLSGLGNGITSGVLLTIGSDFAPRAERNQFLGLWRLQSDIGMALAPFVVGMLAESVSLLVAAWCISGFGFTGAAMLGIFVKETLNKNKMEKQTD